MEKRVRALTIFVFILAFFCFGLVLWLNHISTVMDKNSDIMNQNFQKIENYLNLH